MQRHISTVFTYMSVRSPLFAGVLLLGLCPPMIGTSHARSERVVKQFHISLRHITTGKTVDNLRIIIPDPKNSKNQIIDPVGLRKINDLFRDWRSKFSMRIHRRLIWHLYTVGQHYDASIDVVSGFRKEERKTSRHKQGRAVDFRIKGVKPKELWEFCKRFHPVGVGYYPTSRFIHLDVRDRTHYWIDDSGPGEKPRYRSGVKQLKRKKRRRRTQKKS